MLHYLSLHFFSLRLLRIWNVIFCFIPFSIIFSIWLSNSSTFDSIPLLYVLHLFFQCITLFCVLLYFFLFKLFFFLRYNITVKFLYLFLSECFSLLSSPAMCWHCRSANIVRLYREDCPLFSIPCHSVYRLGLVSPQPSRHSLHRLLTPYCWCWFKYWSNLEIP